MSKTLITIGILFIIAGLLWPFIQKVGLGRLPGDVVIENESSRFYFPIVTCIVISVVLSVLFWLFRKF